MGGPLTVQLCTINRHVKNYTQKNLYAFLGRLTWIAMFYLQMIVAGFSGRTDLSKAAETSNEVRRVIKDLKECQAQALLYNQRERLFEMPVTQVQCRMLSTCTCRVYIILVATLYKLVAKCTYQLQAHAPPPVQAWTLPGWEIDLHMRINYTAMLTIIALVNGDLTLRLPLWIMHVLNYMYACHISHPHLYPYWRRWGCHYFFS